MGQPDAGCQSPGGEGGMNEVGGSGCSERLVTYKNRLNK